MHQALTERFPTKGQEQIDVVHFPKITVVVSSLTSGSKNSIIENNSDLGDFLWNLASSKETRGWRENVSSNPTLRGTLDEPVSKQLLCAKPLNSFSWSNNKGGLVHHCSWLDVLKLQFPKLNTYIFSFFYIKGYCNLHLMFNSKFQNKVCYLFKTFTSERQADFCTARCKWVHFIFLKEQGRITIYISCIMWNIIFPNHLALFTFCIKMHI